MLLMLPTNGFYVANLTRQLQVNNELQFYNEPRLISRYSSCSIQIHIHVDVDFSNFVGSTNESER